jgi:hypothetical protein
LCWQEIKKHTEPNHPDFQDLEEALQKINMVVTVVNEATRHAEMVHKMLTLQSKLSDVRHAPAAHSRATAGCRPLLLGRSLCMFLPLSLCVCV